MASWADLPDPHADDALAYVDRWESRIPDDIDQDENGQTAIGIPGEQRAMPGMVRAVFDDGAHGAQRCSRIAGHSGQHSTTEANRLAGL